MSVRVESTGSTRISIRALPSRALFSAGTFCLQISRSSRRWFHSCSHIMLAANKWVAVKSNPSGRESEAEQWAAARKDLVSMLDMPPLGYCVANNPQLYDRATRSHGHSLLAATIRNSLRQMCSCVLEYGNSSGHCWKKLQREIGTSEILNCAEFLMVCEIPNSLFLSIKCPKYK